MVRSRTPPNCLVSYSDPSLLRRKDRTIPLHVSATILSFHAGGEYASLERDGGMNFIASVLNIKFIGACWSVAEAPPGVGTKWRHLLTPNLKI